jgi:hypothetical protein
MVLYLPRVKSFKIHRIYRLGQFLCTVGTDCDNLPQLQIQYVHIMYVNEPGNSMPIYATACETNHHIAERVAKGEAVEAHYAFGIFPNTETRHITVSWSDQWAELDTFIAKSLEVAREQYEVIDDVIEMPMDGVPERMVFYPDA